MSNLQEDLLKKKYGGLPVHKGLLQQKLKGQDRKYFDSADWAQAKAQGQETAQEVNLPHKSEPTTHKEGSSKPTSPRGEH
mmetsp:Transcript_19426/g.31818  ORF Transcript_19426/g.31818 Transcript_19426/m.31818 type:complete len:80 (-) Transcript_19426:632-871(-)